LFEGWLMVEIIKAIQPNVETVLIRYCFLFTESIIPIMNCLSIYLLPS